MNKRLLLLSVVLAVAGVISVWAPSVTAQSALTEEQRARVRFNCVQIKSTLNQLKVSDALLRVNRGQHYESLSGKYMDRFNIRLANNGLNAQGLLSVKTGYDTALNTFRAHYTEYERQLNTAIGIDCTKDPDGFHLAVENARTKRKIVHDDVRKLHTLIDDYRSAVDDFKLNFQRVSGGN